MTKRQFAIALVLGTGISVTGCQSPSLGGLAFWNKNGATPQASATPDVGSQKFEGLAKEFGGGSRPTPVGHPRPGTSPLGGPPPASEENFFMASWKKTTSAIGEALTPQPKEAAVEDPLRLDNVPKKVGPEVYVAAGRLFENQGKFEEAEQQYNKALSVAPGDVSATVGLARLHDRQGNPTRAIELYHQALKADPASALAYNDLGLCYARQRQLEHSIQALTKATQLQPDNAKYRNNLAAVLVEAGRTEQALRELSAAGSPAVAHYNVGYLLNKRGNTAEAVKYFQQALAIDPTLTPAQEMLTELASQPSIPAANSTAAVPARPAAVTAPYTYGPSIEQRPPFGGATASIADAPLAPSSPATSGSAFHIGDDSSQVSSHYGAPRPLPPVQ